MADYAKGTLRAKRKQLEQALHGFITDHHRALLAMCKGNRWIRRGMTQSALGASHSKASGVSFPSKAVAGSLSIVRARPTIPGSEPNPRFHSPRLNSTVSGPFHLHSAGVNSLPIWG